MPDDNDDAPETDTGAGPSHDSTAIISRQLLELRAELRTQNEELIQRLHALESQQRNAPAVRSLDYNLWSLFFSFSFIVLSFVFSGDLQIYLRHLSTPPISVSKPKYGEDKLLIERHGSRWLSDADPGATRVSMRQSTVSGACISSTVATDGSRRPAPGFQFQLEIDGRIEPLPKGSSEVRCERSGDLHFQVDSFKTNGGELADAILITFPMGTQPPAPDEMAVRHELYPPGDSVTMLKGLDPIWGWNIRAAVCALIFILFAYVGYYNMKTLAVYLKEFWNYGRYASGWILFLVRSTTDHGISHWLQDSKFTKKSTVVGGRLAEDARLQRLVPLTRESLRDFYDNFDTETRGRYLAPSHGLRSWTDGIHEVYTIRVSPGRYAFWSRSFSALQDLEFYVRFDRQSKVFAAVHSDRAPSSAFLVPRARLRWLPLYCLTLGTIFGWSLGSIAIPAAVVTIWAFASAVSVSRLIAGITIAIVAGFALKDLAVNALPLLRSLRGGETGERSV